MADNELGVNNTITNIVYHMLTCSYSLTFCCLFFVLIENFFSFFSFFYSGIYFIYIKGDKFVNEFY